MKPHQFFYDAECPLCVSAVSLRMQSANADHVQPLSVQGNENFLLQHGITPQQAMRDLYAIRNDGMVLNGMPALRLIYSETLVWVRWSRLPILRPLCDWAYPKIARNRYKIPPWLLRKPHCESGTCYKK